MAERGNFWKMVTPWVSVALAKRMVAALGLVNARGEKEFSKHKQVFIVPNSLCLIHFYSIGNCCQRRSSHLPRSMNTMWYGSKVGSYITLPLAVKLFIFQTKRYTAAFHRRRISRQRVRHRACIWINNNSPKKPNHKKKPTSFLSISWRIGTFLIQWQTLSLLTEHGAKRGQPGAPSKTITTGSTFQNRASSVFVEIKIFNILICRSSQLAPQLLQAPRFSLIDAFELYVLRLGHRAVIGHDSIESLSRRHGWAAWRASRSGGRSSDHLSHAKAARGSSRTRLKRTAACRFRFRKAKFVSRAIWVGGWIHAPSYWNITGHCCCCDLGSDIWVGWRRARCHHHRCCLSTSSVLSILTVFFHAINSFEYLRSLQVTWKIWKIGMISFIYFWTIDFTMGQASYFQTWVMSLEQKKLLPVADSLPIVLSLASIVWCLWLIRGNGLILRSRLISRRRRRHYSLLFRRHHRRCRRRRLRRCKRRHNQTHFTSNGGIRRVVQSLVIPWLRVGICRDLGGGCYCSCWVLLSVENVIRWAPSPTSKELFNEFLLLYNHLQINGVTFLSEAE